jgi:hypothetical protein
MPLPTSAKYPVGSRVMVAEREVLEKFAREWRYHHKLTPVQLTLAGRESVVDEVAMYHGGDLLYVLRGLPDYWHEDCLRGIAPASSG